MLALAPPAGRLPLAPPLAPASPRHEVLGKGRFGWGTPFLLRVSTEVVAPRHLPQMIHLRVSAAAGRGGLAAGQKLATPGVVRVVVDGQSVAGSVGAPHVISSNPGSGAHSRVAEVEPALRPEGRKSVPRHAP